MSGSKMTMVPVGGLANRMRAVASAVTLMQKIGGASTIYWFRDWALNAPFSALFEPIDLKGVVIEEGNAWNWLIYDRPRRRNLWIPRLAQQFAFDYRLYENKVVECFGECPDLEKNIHGKHCYVAAFYQLCGYSNELLRKLFRPMPAIMAEVEQRIAHFSAYTVGVHIRRGDNVVAMQRSPIELFFAALDAELKAHTALSIYLATDSEEVKCQMRERYGKRIITASAAADRDSVSGIADGIADMYTLARTKKIYGSSGSSFSELAAQLGDVPLEMCVKK